VLITDVVICRTTELVALLLKRLIVSRFFIYLIANSDFLPSHIFHSYIQNSMHIRNMDPWLNHLSGILPGYSCKEGRIVEDGLLVEFHCTPTRTRSVYSY
jgi:hypothetical protein